VHCRLCQLKNFCFPLCRGDEVDLRRVQVALLAQIALSGVEILHLDDGGCAGTHCIGGKEPLLAEKGIKKRRLAGASVADNYDGAAPPSQGRRKGLHRAMVAPEDVPGQEKTDLGEPWSENANEGAAFRFAEVRRSQQVTLRARLVVILEIKSELYTTWESVRDDIASPSSFAIRMASRVAFLHSWLTYTPD
jgi:hypothetical protein